MKKVQYLAIVGAMLMSLNGYSQGEVTFANSAGSAIRSTVTGTTTTAGQLRVGLYYAAPGSIANPDGTDNFQQAGVTANTLANGIFIAGFRVVPGIEPGQMASLQVRAWSAAFTTYELAYAAGRAGDLNVLVGASDVMTFALGGGSLPRPSLTVHGMLQSFSVSPVPEPSMIALSLLGGLGTLVLLRRRK